MSNYRIEEYDELYQKVSRAVDQVTEALDARTVDVNDKAQPEHGDFGALNLALKLLKDAEWELRQPE